MIIVRILWHIPTEVIPREHVSNRLSYNDFERDINKFAHG